MPSFEPAEFSVMIIAFIGLAFVLLNVRRHRMRLFSIAYLFVVIGAVATVAESFVIPDILNVVEHAIGFMGAGLLFAWVAQNTRKHNAVLREKAKHIGELLK